MRRRYRYDEVTKAIVEVGAVHSPAPRVHILTDSPYAGLRATDGTVLDTRKKHREYMKENGLALYEDYKETFEKAVEARDKEAMGFTPRDDTLRADIAEAYEMVRAGYKPSHPEPKEVRETEPAVVDSYIVGKDNVR